MSGRSTSLFLVEQYHVGGAPDLARLARVDRTVWRWGVELVDERTSLAVVEAADVDAVISAAVIAGIELHHVSRARPLR